MFFVKIAPFFSIGRLDMIQSAFDKFTPIFSSGAIYETLIYIVEKNSAVFVILLRHFWMKILGKLKNESISEGGARNRSTA